MPRPGVVLPLVQTARLLQLKGGGEQLSPVQRCWLSILKHALVEVCAFASAPVNINNIGCRA